MIIYKANIFTHDGNKSRRIEIYMNKDDLDEIIRGEYPHPFIEYTDCTTRFLLRLDRIDYIIRR